MRRAAPGRSATALIVALAIVAVTPGCDDDNGELTGPAAELVGSWTATSFVVGGIDLVAGGLSVTFNLADDGTYSSTVSGDAVGVFCDQAANCTESGNFEATSSSITFDPGTEDEITLSYSIDGDTLTVSGTSDGETISATFQRN